MKAHFLEDVLEMTGYKLTSFNQVDDYGQEKTWKTQKQLMPRKRKNQITSLVEVLGLFDEQTKSYIGCIRQSFIFQTCRKLLASQLLKAIALGLVIHSRLGCLIA